jgi:hypothetical protein
MRKSPIPYKFSLLFVALLALIMFNGCRSTGSQTEIQSGRLNLVEAFGLADAVRIEIMAFDLEDIDPEEEYLPVANVTSPEEIEELVFLLNVDLQETPALACIPEYQLRFWMEDGSQVVLGFSCGDAEFITGEQSVFAGRQFTLPGKFTSRIQAYFTQSEAEIPDEINLLKAAEFGDVIRIEILKQDVGEGSAEISSLLVVEDPDTIQALLLALSGNLPLHPQVRCPVNYFLTFTFTNDSTVTWGYLCGDEEAGILRGDQDYFFGQDIHLGPEFVDLFDSLINP